jgi:hypothetical protein
VYDVRYSFNFIIFPNYLVIAKPLTESLILSISLRMRKSREKAGKEDKKGGLFYLWMA